MRQGKKQYYGSQIVFAKNGQPEVYPIDDEENVDERRLSVGLEPMNVYASHFGIEYHPQKTH
jgi:hypothetical protein